MVGKITNSLQSWTPASEDPNRPEDWGADTERSKKQEGEEFPVEGSFNCPGLWAKLIYSSTNQERPQTLSDHKYIKYLVHNVLNKG